MAQDLPRLLRGGLEGWWARLFLKVNINDLPEGLFGPEAKIICPPRVEIARPFAQYAFDHGIGFVADERNGSFAWSKQNLKVERFLGTLGNAVLNQIGIAMCVCPLLSYIRFLNLIRPSLQQLLRRLQINLFE